jgi:hypothetical protein
MKRSRKWITVVVSCICVAGGLMVWWWLMPPRMCLDFRKVDGLTRLDELKRSYVGRDHFLWAAYNPHEYPKRTGELAGQVSPPKLTGVRPDGRGYYLCVEPRYLFGEEHKERKVYAFDAESRLVAEANSISLGLAPKDELEQLVGVSNDKCWISVNRYIQMDGKWRKIALDTLLEVSLSDGLLKGVIRNVGEFQSVVVDGENRRAFVYRGMANPIVDIYSVDEARVVASFPLGVRAGESFIDYLAGEGVVLSDGNSDPPLPMAVLRLDGTVVPMPHGVSGWWGSDGYVYYVKGSTRIWRCRPGGKEEPVYLGTSILRSDPVVSEGVFHPGSDRSFMCFEYTVHSIWERNVLHVKYVMLDLKTKEYMVR